MRTPPRCGYNRRMSARELALGCLGPLLVLAGACAPRAAAPEPCAGCVGTAAVGWEPLEAHGAEPAPLYDGSGRLVAEPRSYTVAEDRFATVSLGAAEPPAEARPRGVGKRDIALRGARLDNALRYLAHEGRFNLVVEGEMTTPVTLELHGVEPYDAAMALAEAHQLRVRNHRGIVIVDKRPAAAGPSGASP
jgi:hypothetical protein